jgi:hypothetical protein
MMLVHKKRQATYLLFEMEGSHSSNAEQGEDNSSDLHYGQAIKLGERNGQIMRTNKADGGDDSICQTQK